MAQPSSFLVRNEEKPIESFGLSNNNNNEHNDIFAAASAAAAANLNMNRTLSTVANPVV
eukprot:Pgem_evm1s16958